MVDAFALQIDNSQTILDFRIFLYVWLEKTGIGFFKLFGIVIFETSCHVIGINRTNSKRRESKENHFVKIKLTSFLLHSYSVHYFNLPLPTIFSKLIKIAS